MAITGSGRRIAIKQIIIGGLGTASAANVVQVARSSGGTTGGGAITPVLLHSTDGASANTVVNTTWSGQPTLGNVLLRLPVNANGGVIVWTAPPGMEIEARNAEQISLRSEVGTSNVSITVIFEES